MSLPSPRDQAPRDPDWRARVERGFARQGLMRHLGAHLFSVAPGAVEVLLPIRPELCQQHGYCHAGAVWSIADTASGFAAQSLMAPGRTVLTVELKINLLAPATGESLLARGRVERSGRTLTVCRSDVAALEGGAETIVATTLGTFMAVEGVAERNPAG